MFPKNSQTATIVLSEEGAKDFLRIRCHVEKSDEPNGVLSMIVGSVEKTNPDFNYASLVDSTDGKNYFGYAQGTELTKVQLDADLAAFPGLTKNVEETTAGGSTTEVLVVDWALETDTLSDITFVENPEGITVVSATLTDGQVEIEFSADPTNATVVSFTITRAVVSVIHNQ